MTKKSSDNTIPVRGYISPGASPIVWAWADANKFVKNQLATVLTFGCETFLRLEALGVKTTIDAPLDAGVFTQQESTDSPEDCRRYTPSIVVSQDFHPMLFQHLSTMLDNGATGSDLNRHILHVFECWLLAYWARTVGGSTPIAATGSSQAYDASQATQPPHAASKSPQGAIRPEEGASNTPPSPAAGEDLNDSGESAEPPDITIGGHPIRTSKRNKESSALNRFTE